MFFQSFWINSEHCRKSLKIVKIKFIEWRSVHFLWSTHQEKDNAEFKVKTQGVLLRARKGRFPSYSFMHENMGTDVGYLVT